MLGIAALLKLLLPFIPNADQRQAAAQAIQDNYVRFLVATENAIYAYLRVFLVLADAYDLFFNGGRTAQRAGIPVLAEVLIVLWPFFGPAIMAAGPQVVGAIIKASSDIPPAPIAPPVPSPAPTDPGGRNK